jgi:hypothetical protein
MELPPASPNRLYVTRSPKFSVDGRKDVAPTLAEAITKAKSVQTLVVLDETIEEQVVVDGRHNGLRIESGLPGGQSVTWRPPANAAADQPLLRLEGAGTALVKGFSLEGDQRVNTLVRVSGPSAGLRLEDLYFTDARQQSLVLADCAAPVEQPLTVEHVRFTTLHDYSIASHHNAAAIRPAAVECTAESASGTAAPLHLAIRSCRFEGMFRAAVLIECPVEGEIRLNRFYSLRNDERPSEAQSVDSIGVKVPAAGPVRLMIASNTSSRFTTLLHLDRLPPADGVNQIALRSNLVIGTQGDAWVVVDSKPDEAAAKAVFAASDGNVCRPGTVLKGLGAAIIPRKPVAPTEYFNISLADDRTFLRYSKTGKWKVLADAGANGEPAGVPPLD